MHLCCNLSFQLPLFRRLGIVSLLRDWLLRQNFFICWQTVCLSADVSVTLRGPSQSLFLRLDHSYTNGF
jgi:hypothetical protein